MTIGAFVVGKINADERFLCFGKYTLVGVLIVSFFPLVAALVFNCVDWIRRLSKKRRQ